MENSNTPVVPTQYNMSFELLQEQFIISMNALQYQDLNSSEQALFKARNIYQQLTAGLSEAESLPIKSFVSLIEIPTRLLRSSYYSMEEWFKKALEELDTAKKICNDANQSFHLIPANFYNDPGMQNLSDVFRFMFHFYERIVTTSHAVIRGTLDKNEGRYVDEISLYRNAAIELRSSNQLNFHILSPESYNLIMPMVNMLNRLAEINEKKADLLEEKRKKIEFLSPIDRKVFIVHGHNQAIVKELEKMLEGFGIDPIILVDEEDDGKTLIEKFEHYGRLCAFAFVIVTPDDWVENKKKKYFQARPNVLFELGWFCGRYGRQKVRILRQQETPLPSDLNGLVTIDFDEKLEEVFRKIKSILENAGIISPKTVIPDTV